MSTGKLTTKENSATVKFAEDIYITKKGKTVAKLSSANQDKVKAAKSLIGVLSQDITLEDARRERIEKI